MQTQRRISSHSYQKQRGVTTLLAVLMMLSLFTFLAVVTDTGRLYLEKRSLQKNADLAAMETALLYCRDQTLDVEAMTLEDMNVLSAQRNNFLGNDANSTVTVTRNGNAITVALSYKVPASLFEQLLPSDDNEINLTASATAKACEPTAQLSIRSSLVNIDSAQSDLLNAVIGDTLGGSLNLSLASWQSLLDTSINLLDFLDALAVDLGATAGDYDGVLTTAISVGSLLNVAADVLDESGASSVAADVGTIGGLAPLSLDDIMLGDLLNIAEDLPKAALDVPINVLNLVQGGLQLANENSVITIDEAVNVLGLVNGEVSVKVGEAPQISAIGNPDEDDITARTSQADVFISLTSDLLGGLGLSSIASLATQLDVVVKSATATASIENESQTCDGGPTSINSITNTGAATIQIGSIGNTPAVSKANFAAGGYTLNRTPIANVTVLGIPIVRIDMRATLTIASGTTSITHEQNPSEEYLPEIKNGIGESAYSSTGTNLGNVLGLTIDLNPVVIGIIPLGFALNPILNSVSGVLDGVLSNLLIPIINPLLNSLGVDLAGAEVGAALTCENDKVRLTN
jgi:uncharacterized membrane protein